MIFQVQTDDQLNAFNDFLEQEFAFLKVSEPKNVRFERDSANQHYYVVNLEKIIGAITIYTSDTILPIEKELKIDLNPLRKANLKICEIGRFVINVDFRKNMQINHMLFSKIFIYCFMNNVDIVVCQAFEGVLNVCQRFGFMPILKNNSSIVDIEFKRLCFPLYLGMREKVKFYFEYYPNEFHIDGLNLDHLHQYINGSLQGKKLHNFITDNVSGANADSIK